MQSMPRDWERAITELLAELEELYGRMGTQCRSIRGALVKNDKSAVLTGVKELQGLMAQLRARERRAAESLRAWGLLGPAERLSLARLKLPPRAAHPHLPPLLARTVDAAAAAGREAALNRRLIERLSAWLQREAHILLEPFMENGGYGAGGTPRRGAARPAVLDRRG